MQLLFSILTGLCLMACGSSDGGSADERSPTLGSGSFAVKISHGDGFSLDSPRANVQHASDSLISLRASGWLFRVDGNGLPETGPGQTSDLGRNNTMLHLYAEVNGERKRIGCDPDKDPQGFFKRTKLTDQTVSGEVQVRFISCNDYYGNGAVEVPSLPWTVTVTFENLPLSEQ